MSSGRIKNNPQIIKLLKCALAEDIGKGDITTSVLIPKGQNTRAVIVAKEAGILAGIDIARIVFKLADKRIAFKPKLSDGAPIRPSGIIAEVYGPAGGILTAERTALNFLSLLSGVATLTGAFVKKVKPYKTKIMDTRKTTPGLRFLEKYAVRAGGGFNHRFGLSDQVLIKDNHLKVTRGYKRLQEVTRGLRKKIPRNMEIEIEVKNLKEFKDALQAGPDIIMLDNMKASDIRKAVRLRNALSSHSLLEVSGGVTLKNVAQIAKSGVEIISVGALTHSPKSLDLSLDVKGI